MKIAILGASGLVGRAMLKQMEALDWVEDEPLLLTSRRSAGLGLLFRGRELICQDIEKTAVDGVDIALFSAGAKISRRYAPRFTAAGAWVVDNSSAWRMDTDVALIVPEINPQALPQKPAVIANPNCSTIQIVMAVASLHQAWGLREMNCTTMQAVSGAGTSAVGELLEQTLRVMDQETETLPEPSAAFARHIAFNAIPAIGPAAADGSYEEEVKVVQESRKILGLPDLEVTCLAVRIPTINSHAVSIRARFNEAVDRDRAVALLADYPGIQVEESAHDYHTPAQASGSNDVFVGRLRIDPNHADTLHLWVVADNLMKGAAANSVQIAQLIATRTAVGGS
jgi:aspartate-semialdehyde dehydrogenase